MSSYHEALRLKPQHCIYFCLFSFDQSWQRRWEARCLWKYQRPSWSLSLSVSWAKLPASLANNGMNGGNMSYNTAVGFLWPLPSHTCCAFGFRKLCHWNGAISTSKRSMLQFHHWRDNRRCHVVKTEPVQLLILIFFKEKLPQLVNINKKIYYIYLFWVYLTLKGYPKPLRNGQLIMGNQAGFRGPTFSLHTQIYNISSTKPRALWGEQKDAVQHLSSA